MNIYVDRKLTEILQPPPMPMLILIDEVALAAEPVAVMVIPPAMVDVGPMAIDDVPMFILMTRNDGWA